MAERASKRRSVRQLAGRKRASIYYEPDTDDDFGEESNGERDFLPEPRRKKQKLDRRSKPQTRSHAQSRKNLPKSSRPGRPSRSARRKQPSKKTQVLGAPLKKKEKKVEGFTGPSDKKIPAWTSLPIEILRDIFIFAAQPIHEQTTTASTNVTWLMRTARRTCRAFAIPALEAYYQSPYPLTNLQPHHLLELMLMPVEKTYINYKVKVKSLEIDVRRLAYSATGKSRFDLGILVREVPRLQYLEMMHPVDTPPYRPMKIQSWRYPADLFQALGEGSIKLKGWRWNRDMMPSEDIYGVMRFAHGSKAFEYLERLAVCGFDVNDSTAPHTSDDESAPRIPELAAVIAKLPHLKDLTFISCDLVMDNFLDHLPINLERLELSNCLEVTSDMLKWFLRAGGSQLRELILNHNPALNLAFLPQLKMLCPKLEVLKMDLTYYSERYNFNDAWAMYDQLLTEEEIPTWPLTLRHLELVNLQKWAAEAAQNLFRSLVDNARDLPDLRHLVIQAHINIPWRDRAGFRDQWIERLQRVYLRRSELPCPYLGSLRQFRLWKKAEAEGRVVTEPTELEFDDETDTRRKLSHVRVTPRKPPSDADFFDDPGPSTEKTKEPSRRSVRVAEMSVSASPPAEESSSESDEDEGEDWRNRPEAFIQGLCKVVDIRIDNQRPRENQYTEANFLDSEPSGDEDWHSGAELSDDGYAW